MKTPRQSSIDQLHLFEFLEILWLKKSWLFSSTALTLLIAILYLNLSPAKYEIAATISVDPNISTDEKDFFIQLSVGYSTSWIWHGRRQVMLSTTNQVESESNYRSELERLLVRASVEIIKSKSRELEIIKDLDESVKSSEYIAMRVLNHHKYLQIYSNTTNLPIKIRDVKSTKKTPQTKLILIVTTMLGITLGIFLILFREGMGRYSFAKKISSNQQ